MGLESKDGLGIQGRVILRAYPRGLLGFLRRWAGMTYDEMRCFAAEYIRATVESDNIVVTSGKVLVARMLIDDTGYDTGLTWCAIGSDNTAPAVSDTTLGTEEERKEVTSKSRSTAVITYSTFFTSAESNVAIEEVGLFGHSTASATTDSGEMFNHALLSYDNSGASPLDLTVDVEITVD